MTIDMSRKKDPLRIEKAVRGELVTVVVGPESVKYSMHKAVLVEFSGYFKRALQGPWKEADEGVVRLGDIEPETFSIYVDWLYAARMWIYAWSSFQDEGQISYQIGMLKANIFGDRFLSPDFSQNVRNDFIHSLAKFQQLCCQTVIYAYANLPPDDPILRFMVDIYCRDSGFGDQDKGTDTLNDLPMAFVVEVVKKLTDEVTLLKKHAKPVVLNECDYHNHDSEEDRGFCLWGSGPSGL